MAAYLLLAFVLGETLGVIGTAVVSGQLDRWAELRERRKSERNFRRFKKESR